MIQINQVIARPALILIVHMFLLFPLVKTSVSRFSHISQKKFGFTNPICGTYPEVSNIDFEP